MDRYGLYLPQVQKLSDEELRKMIRTPNPDRLWHLAEAFRRGWSVEELYELSHIDRWFLYNIKQVVDFEKD